MSIFVLHIHCSSFIYVAEIKWPNKKQLRGAAEMTQQLRALAALAEVPGQSPAYTWQHTNNCKSNSKGSFTLF